MSDVDLNRLAHEALGKCWHDLSTSVEKYGGMRTYTAECVKCHDPDIPESTFQWEPRVSDFIPDYCNDLNAAAELEAFTIEKTGRDFTMGNEEGNKWFCNVEPLNRELRDEPQEWISEIDDNLAAAIVRACLKALGKMPEGV